MPLVAIIAILGVIVTAAYILLVVRRVFFGAIPEGLEKSVGDVSWMDKVVVGVLAVMMIALGWFPSLMTPMIESGVKQILTLVGG